MLTINAVCRFLPSPTTDSVLLECLLARAAKKDMMSEGTMYEWWVEGADL